MISVFFYSLLAIICFVLMMCFRVYVAVVESFLDSVQWFWKKSFRIFLGTVIVAAILGVIQVIAGRGLFAAIFEIILVLVLGMAVLGMYGKIAEIVVTILMSIKDFIIALLETIATSFENVYEKSLRAIRKNVSKG